MPRRSHWLPKGAPPAGARGQHEPGNGSRGGQLPGTDLEAQADTRPGPGPALRAAGRQLRPRSEGHTHGWTAGDPGGPGTHGVTTASGLGPLGPSTLCAQEPLSLLLAGQPKLRSTGQATGAQDRVTTALRGIDLSCQSLKIKTEELYLFLNESIMFLHKLKLHCQGG